MSYDDMPYATEDSGIGDSLKCIAFINVKKYPGHKKSYSPDIARHFKKNRSLLMRQILKIDPNIIIGGGTLPFFFEDFGLDISMFKKDRSAGFCKHDERLFIHAKHPAQRGSQETYVDDIVQIIKNNCPL